VTHSYSWDDVDALLEEQMNVDAVVIATKTISECRDADAFMRAMYDEKKQIDAACRFFAKNHSWPRVRPLIAMCLFYRVRKARDAVRFLRGRNRAPFLVPSPRCSMRWMLEYLLVDHWRVYGSYKFRR